MKKKFQDWLRKQVGCPECAERAARYAPVRISTTTSPAWPMMSNGQSLTFTYRTRGDV